MKGTQLFKVWGWATYLGCSWTWCIGMFLPALLLRDFGWAAWIAFTVPNVIGAAAMGFVFSQSSASEKFVRRHKPACLAFSAVTILFQVYFLLWATTIFLPPAILAGGLFFLLLLLYGVSWKPEPGTHILSGVVFIVSLTAMFFFAKTLPFSKVYLDHSAFGAMAPQLPYLIPVFIFGFFFSPYLDLTFHHASQQTSAGVTKISFALGFGLIFLSMLVFSLLYAPSVIALFFALSETQDAGFQLANRTGLRLILFVHLILQAGLTVILHLHRLRKQGLEAVRHELLLLLSVVGAAFLLFALGRDLILFGLTGHELIYRMFLAFYGLLAPAYIWTCVIPFRTRGRNRRVDWITCSGAIGFALPFFAWAFMAGEYRALIPGMGLTLVAPLFRHFYYCRIEEGNPPHDYVENNKPTKRG